MKIIFINTDLASVYKDGQDEQSGYTAETVQAFIKNVNLLMDVEDSAQLQSFKGIKHEKLSGTLEGYESINVNEKYSLQFKIQPKVTKQQTAVKCFIHQMVNS